MEKFKRTAQGYDPEEVNAFLDQIINHVEKIVSESKAKDVRIKELERRLSDVIPLQTKLEQYKSMEDTMNKTIYMAQKTADQIKSNSYRESELLVEDAKRNANRIVNEALLKADRIENEADNLKRNINVFKRRLKGLIEQQLDMVDEIEKVEF